MRSAMHAVTGRITMQPPRPLPTDKLYHRCDPDSLGFQDSSELEEYFGLLGQERAMGAIELGTGLDREGYNMFVLGPTGTGRHSFVRQYLEKRAAGAPRPSDWCYVNNFSDPRRPAAIELPAGLGSQFRDNVTQLIAEAHTAIPNALESEEYRAQRQAIEEQAQQEQMAAFEEVRENARKRGLGVIQTATGFAFVPLKDGESVISPKEYQRLSDEDKKRLQQDTKELSHELRQMLEQIPGRVRTVMAGVRELDEGVALFAVGSLVTEMLKRYEAFPRVLEYLRAMKSDIANHVELFKRGDAPQTAPNDQMIGEGLILNSGEESPALRRYGVNLIVDHSDAQGAPVVFETHPTYPYLIGQIEHVSRMGTLVTDFHLIRAGALHRANNGYLIMDALQVLLKPFAWDALKRSLKAGEINIQSLDQAYGFVSTVSLEPEPIPLSTKVIMIGEPHIYYLLQAYDPEFATLFKVKVDFDTQADRADEEVQALARLVGSIARRENLLPIDASGMARLVEESSRLAGDSEMLTTRIADLMDVTREAHYWAEQRESERVTADDVQHAIDAREHRAARIRDRLIREVRRGTIMIDTEGSTTGQVNGLAVFQAGGLGFGHPTRITARVTLGPGKVIDIEREVELGGPIHSKGVLILSNFLGAHYVRDKPLSLSASLVFEQSYSGVEGDSASAAELCALLSAIADLPLKQSMAVTGSVNQLGQVQAIGAVNEKIEGFFNVCRDRGLNGEQAVIIPAANVKHLMLNKEVREAVAAGQFHIYAVRHVDECLSLLTGIDAGERDESGRYPEGTVNRRIVARLEAMADRRIALARSMGGKDKDAD
jgi:lon-related putative ATP-dependent protease